MLPIWPLPVCWDSVFASNIQRLSEVRLGYVAYLASLLSWFAGTLYSHQTKVRSGYVAYLASLLC